MTTKTKLIICGILTILLTLQVTTLVSGCHVSDIPFIGWRIDVANQRKAIREAQKRREQEQQPSNREKQKELAPKCEKQ
jgi:hypothetical protein